jgi:CelD/BcsL family acetyltransferase involved in cellulose biosynthesis
MTLERHASFESVSAEWEALAQRVDAPPFLRPGWLAAWWAAFGHGSLEIVVLRREGRMAAVLPLSRRLGVLRSPTNWHQPSYGAVAADEDARRELALELLGGARRPLALRLLDAEASDCEAFLAAAGPARGVVCTRVQQRSPYLDIAGDWETYVRRAMNSSRRADMRRRQRRLAEAGEVRTRFEEAWDGLDARLTDVLALEASGWKKEAGTAIVCHPATEVFYREIANWAAARGWLRLAFLDLDGRPIAAELMLEHAGVMYGLKGGYAVGLREFGIGHHLRGEVLAQCFARGLRRLDFLGGESPAKRVWTRTARDLVAIEFFPRSTAGVVGVASYRYGRPVAKRTRSYVSRLRH